jgi:hypothetical protein
MPQCLALALSRLIDNSVVVLENIFRHMELGESPTEAAVKGGKEVQLAVLAATFSTCIVFFPVVLLFGVSKYLFTALALAVVLALFASYLVAMTVVPLFCAKFITIDPNHLHQVALPVEEGLDPAIQQKRKIQVFRVVIDKFNLGFHKLQTRYERAIAICMNRPVLVVAIFSLFVICSFALYPFLGKAFFPCTDPGQFVVNVKVPAGTRIEVAASMAAYVGCIGGAILISDYRDRLLAAGFEHVKIVDSGADLNAYAKVENQAGCCSPAMDSASTASCCSTDTPASLHQDLTDLLSKYDVNAAAASVKVYAVKPSETAQAPCCGPNCCPPAK